MVYFDAMSMNLTQLLASNSSFSFAIILLGDTQPNSCFNDPKRSNALNIGAVKRIIDVLNQHGIPILFASSEFVFDGAKGNYTEEDIPKPILLYGQQKRTVETYLQETSSNYTIVRLGKIFGSEQGDCTLFTGWATTLNSGKTELTCATDQRFSPIYMEDVIKGILTLIKHNCHGIFHLAGPKSFTRWELLDMIVAEYSRYVPLSIKITACSIHDFDLPEKRPVDVSMAVEKIIRRTRINFTDTREVCAKIVHDYMTRRGYT